jgi:hypothetical protein
MMDVVKKGINCEKNAKEIKKKNLKEEMKTLSQKKKYEGFPVYLISNQWKKKY